MSPAQQVYTPNYTTNIVNIQAQIILLHRINSLLLLRISQLEDVIHNLTDNAHDFDDIPDHQSPNIIETHDIESDEEFDEEYYIPNTSFNLTFHTNSVII